MKKVFKFLLVVLFLFVSTNVYAEADYSYRAKKDNRIKVKVNGYDLYMSVNVLFNMDGDFAGVSSPIENFDAEYKDGTFYVTVKRSELNKVFKNKSYDNVYSLFEISADFMDFKPDKKYFYIYQLNYDSAPGEGYSMSYVENDYLYSNYKFLEVENSPVRLSGYASNTTGSTGGGFAIYETDKLPEEKRKQIEQIMNERREQRKKNERKELRQRRVFRRGIRGRRVKGSRF